MAVRISGALVTTVRVGDAEGTADRVSVRDEAYVETASVRRASVSTMPVGSESLLLNEKSNVPRIRIMAMDRILVFITLSWSGFYSCVSHAFGVFIDAGLVS